MFTQELINDGLRSYIKIDFDDENTLDLRALQNMNRAPSEAILLSKVVYESKLPVLWFSIENKMSLHQWVEKHGKLNKKEFIDLMNAVIGILLDSEPERSPYYFILSADNIFIDPVSRQIALTYVPDFALKGYFLNRVRGMVKEIVPKYVHYSKAEKLYSELYEDLDAADFNVMKLKNTLAFHSTKIRTYTWSVHTIKKKIVLSLEALLKHSKHMILRMKKEKKSLAMPGPVQKSAPVLLAPDELDQTGHFLDAATPYLLRLSNHKRHPVNLEAYKQFIIGRSDTIALSIQDGTLSREHAKIERSGDLYHIKDLDSLNGTHVNGEALKPDEPHVLTEGDEVAIADIKFVWKVKG